MPKTLLAVDDSATMRRVLEITFSGEDYRVVTAESANTALGNLSHDPAVVVIDTVLGSDDGYALSKEVRKRNPSATIVLLSSRHNPYDAAKGRDAGADDFMDKPFDTQQMVDKVKKAILGRDSGPASTATYVGVAPAAAMGGAPGAPIPAPIPVISPAPPPVAARPAPAAPPPPAPAAAKPAVAPPAVGRANTLMFGTADANKAGAVAPTAGPAAPPPAPKPAFAAPPAAPAAAARPAAPAPSASPAPPKVAPIAASAAPTAPPGAAAAASKVNGQVNGQLASKLGDLGLTPAQIEGVLALSREVVERVVWEVVPELAETMIREEIARLTKA